MKNQYFNWRTSFCNLLIIFFSFSAFAQVGIGTSTPNDDAILDITSTTGGLLMPRIALAAVNSFSPMSAHVAGMTVYNTVTAGTGINRVTPGYYYNDGGQWVRITGSTSPNTNWELTGNTGIVANTNFLGPINNAALRFRTNNVERFEISIDGRLRSNDFGTFQLPTYSWIGRTNTGMFSPAVNTLGYSTSATERMRILPDGRVSINLTGAYSFMLNSNATGTTGAIIGNSANGTAVQGQATGSGNGVVGLASTGTGVYGGATATNTEGGFFTNTHNNGFGVVAQGGTFSAFIFNNSGTGASFTGRTFGSTSFSATSNGMGLAGVGDNLGGIPLTRPLGVGVLGYGKEAGVFGDSGYYGSTGVHGSAEGNFAGTNYGTGVYGENVGGLGDGVFGESTNVGVRGFGANGAILESNNNAGYGAVAWNTAGSGDRVGLLAIGQNLTPLAFAGTGGILYGRISGGAGFAQNVALGTGLIGGGNDVATVGVAANGSGVAGTGTYLGVFGKGTRTNDGIGVVGVGNNLLTYNIPPNGAGVAGTGVNIGVYGHATDASGFGVYSSGNLHATGDITADGDIAFLGDFSTSGDIAADGFDLVAGALTITGAYTGASLAVSGEVNAVGDINSAGDITAQGAKNFIIDDPRDPANKYLKHASIESNEILNLYRGVDTFNASGEVVVQLPDYYDAINKNASYQLTPIGAAMPNLYIATKVNNGIFVIAGGVAGKEVSWTLTAERNDPYIRSNPEIRNMVVDKGADRGRYLAPEVYGQSADQGIVRSRMNETSTGSRPAIENRSVVSQEIQSKTAEVSKKDSDEIRKLTMPFKPRDENKGEKQLRDVPLTMAEDVKVADKAMEQDNEKSVSPQQNSESEKAPTKTLNSEDNN